MLATIYLKSGQKVKVEVSETFIGDVERHMADDRTSWVNIIHEHQDKELSLIIPRNNIDYFDVER